MKNKSLKKTSKAPGRRFIIFYGGIIIIIAPLVLWGLWVMFDDIL